VGAVFEDPTAVTLAGDRTRSDAVSPITPPASRRTRQASRSVRPGGNVGLNRMGRRRERPKLPARRRRQQRPCFLIAWWSIPSPTPDQKEMGARHKNLFLTHRRGDNAASAAAPQCERSMLSRARVILRGLGSNNFRHTAGRRANIFESARSAVDARLAGIAPVSAALLGGRWASDFRSFIS